MVTFSGFQECCRRPPSYRRRSLFSILSRENENALTAPQNLPEKLKQERLKQELRKLAS